MKSIVDRQKQLTNCNRSIDTDGLSTSKTLPLSGNFDSVLCSHVMDVDWDGEKEILIGTYGRQVLIYKQGKAFSGSMYNDKFTNLHT